MCREAAVVPQRCCGTPIQDATAISSEHSESKFCPVCGENFSDEYSNCPDDGARLLFLTADQDLVGRMIDGKYEVTHLIGEGGMGKVYAAYQEAMDREVAVKVLHPYYTQDKEALQRFMREARAASRLSHPNTIRVFDFGQTEDGLLFMVLEMLRGRSLADIIDEDGRMPYRRAVDITVQVCDALAEAHAMGIVHRDLKPDNIFIVDAFGRPDHVKLLDFGIAKMESDIKATRTGAIVGTPTYMSPEQATGNEAIDGRSDIYALGAILFEMITGEVAFDGSTPLEILVKHLHEPPPSVPEELAAEIPDALLGLIEKMLAKEREDRHPDAQAARRALEAAANAPLSSSQPQPRQARETVEEQEAVTARSTERVRTSKGMSVGRTPLPEDYSPRSTGPHPTVTPPGGSDEQRVRTGQMRPGETDPELLKRYLNSRSAPRLRRPTVESDPSLRPRTSTGTRMRPANINLVRAGSGHRFELVATGPSEGVLHGKDSVRPEVGVRFVLVADDVMFRTMQLTVEVIRHEDVGGNKNYFRVRWLNITAGGSRQLVNSVARITGRTIAVDPDYENLPANRQLGWDPITGEVRPQANSPHDPHHRVRHPTPTPQPERAKRPTHRRQRRILEITTKKGTKGGGPAR